MMRTETTIEWNGDEVKFRAREATGKSTYELGLAVESQAKNLTPVASGRLRGSITTQSATSGTEVGSKAQAGDKITGPSGGLDTYVGTNVEYGPYVEHGLGPYTLNKPVKIPGVGWRFIKEHPGIDAQPFLRPALDSVLGRAVSIVRKNAKREFGDYLKQ